MTMQSAQRVKCIETYRNNTSRFNESESDISQTIALDILTQVLENIDPHFKRLEETVLNHTSKGFANFEEQIKSIAAYQQNSEKVVHPNSETDDNILAELWSRLAKNMTKVSPKTTDSEISLATNTAKLTVQSDKQVAESKEILERISEGVKCTETFTNNTSLSNESRSDFSQDIAFDALVSELDNLLLKIKNLESQLNVTHAQINETILNQVAYLDLKTNQTEQDLTDLWTQMKANANQINNTISNIESFKSNISKAIKDANFNGEISATNINNLHEEVRNDLIKTVNNILPRLVNLEERIKTIGVEAHSEHTNKDGTFLRKTLSNSTGTFNEKPTDSNVATHLSGQDDTIKQAHESKEILEQIRDGTNAISGIKFCARSVALYKELFEVTEDGIIGAYVRARKRGRAKEDINRTIDFYCAQTNFIR
ncbi:hypothetical protein HUJ04_002862 [Dendroctonus ponderosae]|nr:hypothetical protein HUJ04_002862 [Dendroctonus ponderosae]